MSESNIDFSPELTQKMLDEQASDRARQLEEQNRIPGFEDRNGRVVDNRQERIGVLGFKEWTLIAVAAATVLTGAGLGVTHPEILMEMAKVVGVDLPEKFVQLGSVFAGAMDFIGVAAAVYVDHEMSKGRAAQSRNTNQE